MGVCTRRGHGEIAAVICAGKSDRATALRAAGFGGEASRRRETLGRLASGPVGSGWPMEQRGERSGAESSGADRGWRKGKELTCGAGRSEGGRATRLRVNGADRSAMPVSRTVRAWGWPRGKEKRNGPSWAGVSAGREGRGLRWVGPPGLVCWAGFLGLVSFISFLYSISYFKPN